MPIPVKGQWNEAPFRHLEIVARIAMVAGWIFIIWGGIMLVSAMTGASRGNWMGGMIMAGAGMGAVLSGGTVDILIAIEGHLRKARGDQSNTP